MAGCPGICPSDLKRFKALTLGKPVSWGARPGNPSEDRCQGRPNIVISRKADFEAAGAIVVPSLEAALAAGRQQAAVLGVDEVCIIGGGEIYRQALDVADMLHITQVSAVIDGDTTFPTVDLALFDKTADEVLPQGEKDSHAMRSVTFRRKNPAN